MEATGFIQVRDLNLAWISNNNDGPAIFFIHGNSGSARTWHQQLEDPQLARYRLVAIELPGHGRSYHSANPDVDYSPVDTGRIMAEAVTELADDKPYLLVGFSYGTNVIAEMIYCGATPVGVFLVGMCCIGEGYGLDVVFKKPEMNSVFLYNESDRAVVEKFLHRTINNKAFLHNTTNDYIVTDLNFKPSLFKAAAAGMISDEISTLEKQDFPVAVVYGEEENLVHPNYADSAGINYWKQSIIRIPGANHFAHLDAPKDFNRLLDVYAEERFTAVHALPQS